ncbi:cysteine desulfurase family protein [Rossellomorea aquimaris]|uniref:Cysteine desulfurase n=1 Tax=Rossellomorea aquimaris TaxID=189382 RepID=A0A5D4U9Y8_9BACI|nr:cysteine desulfurase family protein [Rossellomorea aquimaris]TYS84187.1 cysteine desulfurase [Rossellomorea aquimaris]
MIYFDNSATTKPYKEVIHAFTKVNEDYFANPSSIHALGGKVESLISKSRKQVAGLLGIKETEVFFTSGGTESNNLALKGTALQYRNRGRHIITSVIEHPSILETCGQLERLGYTITYLPVDSTGCVKVEDVVDAIKDETILVSIMHVNNEVGSIQPIEEIGNALHAFPKIIFHVDHIQGLGKVPLSFYESRVNLCSISGHKIHGLKGTGMLYIQEGLEISPLLSGGEQERKIRSGTENTGGIVSFAKALRLHFESRGKELAKMQRLNSYLRDQLKVIEGITIHSPEAAAPHILNFSVQDIRGEILVHALEEFDIFVSTTSACSSKKNVPSRTLLGMGVAENLLDTSIRVSFSFENTIEEVDSLCKALKTVKKNLEETTRRKR